MSAVAMHSSSNTYRSPLVWSAMGHVLLAFVMSTSMVFMPDVKFERLAIEAVLIDQNAVQRAPQQDLEQERRQAAEAARIRQEQQRQREQELAAQRKQEEAVSAQRAAEQRATEEQRKLQAAEQRKVAEAEAARREQEEAARRAEEQRAQQKLAEQKRAAEAAAKAAAEKREQQRLQAELAAALEAEEALLAASQSGEMNRYKALIQQRVQRKWQQPKSAVAGVECQVSVKQLPNGEIIDVKVQSCNGDLVFERSVVDAVYAASPLPLPNDARLFDRNLAFSFRPQVEN